MIIENPTEFESFLEKYKESDCIVIPILSDINLHPLENTLCAIYVKLIDGDEYILPFNHGESMNLDISLFDKLNSDHKKYVYDRKHLNHIVKWDNVIDINLQYYMEYNQPLSTEDISTNSHDYFSRKYYKTKNINRVIPLLKHLELCRKLSNEYQKYIDLKVHQEYNEVIVSVV